MSNPSNLPPGVTDRMIEEQAGVDSDTRRAARQRYQVFYRETLPLWTYLMTCSSYSDAVNYAREFQLRNAYVTTEVRMHPDDKPSPHKTEHND